MANQQEGDQQNQAGMNREFFKKAKFNIPGMTTEDVKQRVYEALEGIPGILSSISFDLKNKKMTMVATMNVIHVWEELRKIGEAKIISVDQIQKKGQKKVYVAFLNVYFVVVIPRCIATMKCTNLT
ncbi:uncharacterized protein LOC143856130 [Tasmannia lanceolata]|uniref:uncharacterized protein LOC143856130 n=1 Tax=Tasmannia lanceolata TaxID=3420 RepID=UPI004064B3CE